MPSSQTPPAEAPVRRLAAVLLRRIAERRAGTRRSAYAGWPQRREADTRQARWPLWLRDPEEALVRLTDEAERRLDVDGFTFDRAWRRYTPAEKRAAAQVALVALALEDA